MHDVGRPRKHDFPPYMYPDGDRGGFVVINPLTRKKKRFGADEEDQARETAALIAELVEKKRQKDLLDAGKPTIAMLVDRWKAERMPLQPWDDSTRETAEDRLNRIKREIGERLIEETDCVFLNEWLSKTATRADPFNKWRYILILLWRFAVSEKWAQSNEAEKVEMRSTSRKIASNRKRRRQLDVEGFQAIHEKAPPWLQLAMELSLVTLLARREVCNMEHTHFRGGWIYVIRDKVAADSNMAFIKIRITPELEALRARAMKLDNYVSPFLVHRKPDRMQKRWVEGKKHWTYVNESYLTKAFAHARDQVSRFADMPERERPTFHEIRGLGARLQQLRGRSKQEIRMLMTHSDEKTTQIYLELGPDAITDEHFHPVSAPFTVTELLGQLGQLG